jgi:hypothetical protein
MLKEFKVYLTVALLSFCGGYLAKTIQEPAKVDNSVELDLKNQVTELSQKLLEAESIIAKTKSEQKSKKKVLVQNVDGSSTLTETEDSSIIENELIMAKSKTVQYSQKIEFLEYQLKEEQSVRNNLLRLDARFVYDSDRGTEYEGSAGYKFLSGGAGINPEKKAWRVSGGIGFNF